MNVADFRTIMSVLLGVGFLVLCVSGAMIVYYFDKLVTKFGTFLDMISAHGALTDDKSTRMKTEIIEAVNKLPLLTATKVLETQANVSLPDPPPLPGTPGKPAPSIDLPTPPPPTRLGLVLAGALLSLGLTAAHPGDITVSIESGKAALRHKNWHKAESMFARAGDDLGIAEAFLNENRYDEAAAICERYPQDGKAKLFSALIARHKGDMGGAHIMLCEARDVGNEEARDLLAMEAKRS